jgi:hypothetical protein
MEQTLVIDEENPGSGCRTQAECNAGVRKMWTLIGVLFGISVAPPIAAALISTVGVAKVAEVGAAVCLNDGDCTNEVSSAIELLAADGDPTNEASIAANQLNRLNESVRASGGFSVEQVKAWFEQAGVYIHYQSQQLLGNARGIYASTGDGLPGYVRILKDAPRLTWLHEYTHYVQDLASGFVGITSESVLQYEYQAWLWLQSNAETLGLTIDEIAEVERQIEYYLGQLGQ